MKYIPGSIIIQGNQISMRIIPVLKRNLTYKLNNIKKVITKVNDKNIVQYEYMFVEFVKPPVMKPMNLLDRVSVKYDSFEQGDQAIDRALGIGMVAPSDNTRPAIQQATRAKLNEIARRSFGRQPRR